MNDDGEQRREDGLDGQEGKPSKPHHFSPTDILISSAERVEGFTDCLVVLTNDCGIIALNSSTPSVPMQIGMLETAKEMILAQVKEGQRGA
jgi:hypothetical protein